MNQLQIETRHADYYDVVPDKGENFFFVKRKKSVPAIKSLPLSHLAQLVEQLQMWRSVLAFRFNIDGVEVVVQWKPSFAGVGKSSV